MWPIQTQYNTEPMKSFTHIFFRKCFCDFTLLLMFAWEEAVSAKLTSHSMVKLWAGELAEHFHCPHARCWRQPLRYQTSNDYCFQWGFTARKTTDWVPDCLQISSAKDDDTDPNHPASPTAASFSWWPKWAVAGNKLLNHLPALKRPSGSLCRAAGRRNSNRFVLKTSALKGTVHPTFLPHLHFVLCR